MPVMKKQFELNGKEVWVRQASGMERLRFETLLAKTFRKFRHFGPDPDAWTEDQQEEFLVALEEAGGGLDDQIRQLVPPCLPDELDINDLDATELMLVYNFVKGGDPEGSVPLAS